MLKFSFHNHKLMELAHYLGMPYNRVVSFDLPAGWTCPKADLCKTFSARDTGKIRRVGRIMCYASKGEAYAPSARRLRWHNFDLLRECGRSVVDMANLITESLPVSAQIVRIHSSGDFYRKEYYQAWVRVAELHPDITFFAYTKILDYALDSHPANMHVQYSYGSKDDTRWNPWIPTCFITGVPSGYPYYVKVLCNGEGTAHEDFQAILNRQSFIILEH